MISPLYTHIGAGVAQADGWVYYTIVVGYIAGSAGSGSVQEIPSSPIGSETDTTPLPTVIPVEPISIATPAADGSIQHVVQPGQFLENIANAYDVELDDLLALNELVPQTVIFPGDKLLILGGSSSPPDPIGLATPTADNEPTSIPTSTATAIPTVSIPTPAAALIDAVRPSPTAISPIEPGNSASSQSGNQDILLYAVVGLAVAGTGMILFGSTLKQRSG
jgi:LysM repeat protein